MFKKKPKKTREEIIREWMRLIPAQNVEFEENEENRVVLLVPHQENWLTKKLLPAPKKPAGRIKLDEIGTFVWGLCDGTHTVKSISEKLDEKFGERVHPADERTVIFLQQMYQQEFIQVYE
ncbi:MAG: hypothetical protein Kow0037_30440 [Calditrichia bacterium]